MAANDGCSPACTCEHSPCSFTIHPGADLAGAVHGAQQATRLQLQSGTFSMAGRQALLHFNASGVTLRGNCNRGNSSDYGEATRFDTERSSMEIIVGAGVKGVLIECLDFHGGWTLRAQEGGEISIKQVQGDFIRVYAGRNSQVQFYEVSLEPQIMDVSCMWTELQPGSKIYGEELQLKGLFERVRLAVSEASSNASLALNRSLVSCMTDTTKWAGRNVLLLGKDMSFLFEETKVLAGVSVVGADEGTGGISMSATRSTLMMRQCTISFHLHYYTGSAVQVRCLPALSPSPSLTSSFPSKVR